MIVMVVDHRGNYLEQLRTFSAVVVEPVYRVAALPSDVAQAGRLAIATQSQLVDENHSLREALLLAQVRLNRMSALSAQNDRLKKLLDVPGKIGLSVQLAKLINIDLDPFRHRIVLDAGTAQSIIVGRRYSTHTGSWARLSRSCRALLWPCSLLIQPMPYPS